MAGGRPRAFDVDEALDRALEVFWRHGYEGAGISQLTSAMGINPPSLYNAFGNKQELFRRVLDRYADGPAGYMREAFDEPTARRVVERLLHSAADATTRPDHPRGCLTLQGGLAASPGAEKAVDELAGRRAAGEVALRMRMERARDEGELPAGTDPADLARYFATVLQGLAIQAVGGASADELHRVVDLAMRAWPAGG
ncbi:TetR/AcrR family transcriptional regulator [Streptacidiphilus sp. ASG 303]|uniref:TetR/AcrR family transcriptional regulator n=1 Tax=Streptacidiphilus sp. ASG 303 TaxID=2896847 RepID=UPI001E466590|nr:TetR/AcrR family transcriptional regulator [Streptacidiphilus sp. ASG 303]MCD0484122.1 TetR/AcrR family transcriptional regulator [Streptacidiphilus sp. ASG 303]